MPNVDQRKARVEHLLNERFAISISDVGFDEQQIIRHCAIEPEPEQFVDWLANRYDLDSIYPLNTFSR